jgi:ketosteroid isomerase-like protein
VSESDVENAQRGYALLNDAYRSGDIDDLRPFAAELWDPGMVLRLPGGILGGGEEWHGVDGMLQFIAHQMEAFREMWVEPQEYRDRGEVLIVPVRFGGQARHTGIEVEFTSVHLIRMKDGKVVRFEAFESLEEAEAAAAPPG